MASKVGPAVTSTRLPARTFGWKAAISSVNSCSGSSMRPRPTSPHACSPAAGPNSLMPSSRSCCTLRCVAGFCHISTFMAGATSKGRWAGRARHRVESRSSHTPCASLRRKSAEHGAIRMASAWRVKSICAMLLSMRASHWLVCTGWPDRACIVTAVMKWLAASVITTCTEAPDLVRARHSSAAL